MNNMTGIEELIAGTIFGVFGNPMYIGLVLLIFFIGIGIAFALSFEAMLVFLIPAGFLLFEFVPVLKWISAIGISIVLFIAVIRLVRK